MIRIAKLLIVLAVPESRYRACVLGDLHERHTKRAQHHGRVRAALWYWSETVSIVSRYLADRAMGRLRVTWLESPPKRDSKPRANAMETLTHDIGYALRGLRRAPGFTATAALTIALGIGATTTVFSVTDAVLLRPPPGVRDADRLITAHRVSRDGSGFHAFSYPDYADYRVGDNGLSGLAAYNTISLSLAGTGEPEMTAGFLVSENYFDVLGTRPELGRFFLSDEGDIATTPLVAVLSHRTWVRRFAADSSIVGQSVTINRRPFTVVGVAEEGFAGHATLIDAGVFLPLGAASAVAPTDLSAREQVALELVGRLGDGVTLAQAQSAMGLIAQALAEDHPESNRGNGVDVRAYTPMIAPAAGAAAAFMSLLFTVAAVILLIASLNVGGMLLSRGSTRGKEIALRLAIGAPRWRLIRQLLTESVVLFVVGAGVGVTLTLYATRLLNVFRLPIPFPLVYDFTPDTRALVFSLSVALATGLVFGLAPALRLTKPDLTTNLQHGAHAITHSRMRSGFVVVQVAGSALLLVGAGLFLRALARADTIDLGMNPDGVHVAEIDLGLHNYTEEEANAFFDVLTARIDSLPGVMSSAMIDMPPLSLGNQTSVLALDGREPVEGEGWHSTDFATVTPAYFETMAIPMIAGRAFTAADRDGAPGVTVVNEAVARRVWPGDNAVGKRIRFGSRTAGTELEVVGVVATGKYRSVGESDRFMLYVPYDQFREKEMAIVVRLDRPAPAFGRRVREAVDGLDAALPLRVNAPYRELMGLALLPNQAAAALASFLGMIGLVLAGVGLYGVLAFNVAQRTHEIGIRRAIGATDGQVQTMVLTHGVRLAAIGLAVGFALAVAVTRLLQGMLFGVSPTDPTIFGGIAAVLLTVSLIAASLPAIRATRTNPVDALRM